MVVRLTVLPEDGKAYDLPIEGRELLLHTRNETGDVADVSITVQAVVPDWAAHHGIIRVEGFLNEGSIPRRVIGYYRIHSTEENLGRLEIQDP